MGSFTIIRLTSLMGAANLKITKENLTSWEADLAQVTKDIAATLGAQKGDRVLVGFAMETENEQLNAQGKLERKNFDFIVLNSLRTEGAGFRGDTNVVTLIDKERSEELPLMSKREVAERIVDKIENFL